MERDDMTESNHTNPAAGKDSKQVADKELKSITKPRRVLFWMLALVSLVAYGAYSYAGFRIALKSWQYLDEKKTATARTGFQYVLDRQSFSLAVPFARAALLYKTPQPANAGEDRLAIWGFERMVNDTYRNGVSALGKVSGDPILKQGLEDSFTPLTCDFAPLAALVVSIPLSIALFGLFFLRKYSSFARRVGGFILAIGALTWVLADPCGGLRAMLIHEGWPFEATMLYDYAKYLVAGAILLLTMRQYAYIHCRYVASRPQP